MNNIARNIMFGGIFVLLAACATDPDIKPDAPIVNTKDDLQPMPMWQFCEDTHPHSGSKIRFKDFIESSDAIFTGKVVERRMTFENAPPFNGCWVKVKVMQTLKGTIGSEVWVKAYFSHENRDAMLKYESCYLKTGEKYLLTGRYKPANSYYSAHVAVWKDIINKPRYRCSPVEKIENSKDVIKEIQLILKDGEKQ